MPVGLKSGNICENRFKKSYKIPAQTSEFSCTCVRCLLFTDHAEFGLVSYSQLGNIPSLSLVQVVVFDSVAFIA